MNELMSIETRKYLWEEAVRYMKADFIPAQLRGKPENVYFLVCYGQELGLNPVNALRSFCLINGQVTMTANAMKGIVLSKVKGAKFVYDSKNDDKKCVVTGYRGDNEYQAVWTIERAEQMGLASKHNWKAQPMNMLKARADSEVMRTLFADVLLGLYSQEEMIDVVETKTVEQDLIDGGKEYLQEYIKNDMEKNPDHYKVGEGTYMVQHAKFRGKQLENIDSEEMADYLETLEKREKRKDWENELITSMRLYLGKLNAIEAGI